MEKCRNRLGRWYDRALSGLLPSSRLLGALFCVVLNGTVYWGAQWLTMGRDKVNMTTPLDELIPVVPAWVLVYVGAFLFWVVGYVLLARGESWYSVMTGEVMAKLLCGVIFVALPTTNLRPALGNDLCSRLLGLIYALDAPTNLFPSIHCLESWICFAGLRGRGDIPRWYRGFSLGAALLICASTVLTRQHVLVDVLAGVLLAEGCLYVSRKGAMGSRLRRWMTGLDGMLFGKPNPT